jgi:hypothetical protein
MAVGEQGKDGGSMSKQRKSNSEKLRMDADWLAKQMTAVSTMMLTVAKRMEDFAVLNPKMKPSVSSVRVLAIHGAMLSMLADEVRAQAKKERIK